MQTGHAVIGANYGDEGKGLMTDYLASRRGGDCLVVRFNGGAQAGHTVVAPDGRRHVFSHFGAGAFAGCPTLLSQFFIVNPLLFCREYKELLDIGLHPVLSIHSRAYVTTPYDIFINQLIERRRGRARHGSCGVGINETVTRCLRSSSLRTTAEDLLTPKKLFGKLMGLGRVWFLDRLAEHHVDTGSADVEAFVEKQELIMSQFIWDVESLLDVAEIRVDYPTAKRVIFEGAQGLMLDEFRIDQWPHLTRSRTGLANVTYLAPKLQLDELKVTYVTRTYLTRHGAGPLAGEQDWTLPDATNVVNQFQGQLRFAPLDGRNLGDSISLDLAGARRVFPQIEADLAVTCVDQLNMPRGIDKCLPINYVSSGPTRADVDFRCGGRGIGVGYSSRSGTSVVSAEAAKATGRPGPVRLPEARYVAMK